MKINHLNRAVSLLISLLFLLSGCISVPVYKNYDLSAEEVASVDVYDLRNSDDYQSGFHEKTEVAYTIPEEQLESFLSDLADIRFSDSKIIFTIAAVDPSFYFGEWVVRINYADGSFDLISSAHYGEQYDQNGKWVGGDHFGCDDDLWNDLMKNHLPERFFTKRDVKD